MFSLIVIVSIIYFAVGIFTGLNLKAYDTIKNLTITVFVIRVHL